MNLRRFYLDRLGSINVSGRLCRGLLRCCQFSFRRHDTRIGLSKQFLCFVNNCHQFGMQDLLLLQLIQRFTTILLELGKFLCKKAQVEYLVQTAEEVDNIGPILVELVDEWAVGDVEGLGDLLNEALESDPVLANRLLYTRNANWAVWIDERLDSPGTIFMAVGAGHMAGNQKLQDKLAERGITMTRIQ